MTTTPPPIEVFGIGPDGELVPLGPSENQPAKQGDLQELFYGPLYQAKPGVRPGGFADRPERNGGREDVVAPVPVDPIHALRALSGGGIFSQPISEVMVDVSSLKIDPRGLSWVVSVDCGRLGGRRQASLWAYSSPSSNLTVLELVPARPRLIFTNAFIDAGVRAVSTLSLRLIDHRLRHDGALVAAPTPVL